MWGGHRRPQILVTGSADCTVRVWDLRYCSGNIQDWFTPNSTGSLLHTFYEHTATVHTLSLGPSSTEMSSSFYSVGNDDAVVVYSLRKLDWYLIMDDSCLIDHLIVLLY